LTPPENITVAPEPVLLRGVRRARRALSAEENWRQLLRFAVVGASGYAVNLLVFAAFVMGLGAHHLVAAAAAFLVAVSNNFWWNRRWTFAARGGCARLQARRYLTTNVGAFILQAALLELLVSGLGTSEIPAQAVSVAVTVPVNFAGNKLWTFGRSVPRVR
jgi:dolichol-phosphate mannosyltransferase